jgi:hypothetical protein
MYDFILNQWKLRKIDETKVRGYAPKWITSEQATAIIATPQVIAD